MGKIVEKWQVNCLSSRAVVGTVVVLSSCGEIMLACRDEAQSGEKLHAGRINASR